MNKKINHPVFQINDSTWGHLIKTVNPDTYTIEYGHIAGFSSKEEAEKSYREYVNSYQTQIFRLKVIQKHAFRLQIPSKKKNYRNQIKASSKVPVGKIYENPFDDDYLLELME